jgi:excisionase family DNA binding protein
MSMSPMSTTEAAEYLRLSTKTLERWRRECFGPPHVAVGGRRLYLRGDLDEWLLSHRVANARQDHGQESDANSQSLKKKSQDS